MTLLTKRERSCWHRWCYWREAIVDAYAAAARVIGLRLGLADDPKGEGTMSAAAVLAFIGALTVVAGFVSALVIAATYTTVGVLYLIGRIRGTHR